MIDVSGAEEANLKPPGGVVVPTRLAQRAPQEPAKERFLWHRRTGKLLNRHDQQRVAGQPRTAKARPAELNITPSIVSCSSPAGRATTDMAVPRLGSGDGIRRVGLSSRVAWPPITRSNPRARAQALLFP
jgi:hypothetical protein